MKIESGVYGMKPIKRLSGDIAYTQKQVIPSCLLTQGDELSEKNGDYLLSHCYAVPSA
uniref:hypothetical protein n=1 Tax=Bacteroides fragilis TaxID=817 RepID=UPI00356157C5